jgi:type I restriction enzyme S subunit
VQTGDVKNAELWLTEYSQTYNDIGLAQSKLWPVGTLCITIAANIAETAILKIPACFPDSIVGFAPHPGKSDARFVKYFIDTLKLRMQNVSKGTTQDNLSLDKLLAFDFDVPTFSMQIRIADILSAYDDLIENNTRRIKILEEMAQMIYREWFVNFRFPGHENVPMVESELGAIPEGWSAQNVGSTSVNFDSKRKPLSSVERAKRPGPYPYYGAARVFDYIDDYLFDGRYLLFAEDGTVITDDRHPVLQLTDGRFWPNNHTHVLQGRNPVSTYFLYLAMRQVDVSGCITGAAQPKITQANLNRIPVVCPTDLLFKRFDILCSPMLDAVAVLNKKQRLLRTTRDLLLPKLISGEISVEAADNAAAELMDATA